MLLRNPVSAAGPGTDEIAGPHREQRDDDRDVAERVDRERHAGPRQRDDEPAEGRPDDPRRRAESGAERDRVGQVALPDDPEDERVPRWVVEHEHEALEDGDDVHLPEHDRARQREHGQRGRGERQQRLRHEQQAADVEAVDHRADEEAEERHGQELRERERSDGERRAGQLEHEPVGGDLLHPRADERHGVADEVEPEVAVVAQARERPSADPREESRQASSPASIGWPVVKTPSPASVAGIARITASTPSSGARSTSGGRPGVSGNHSRATGSPARTSAGGSSSRLEDPVLGRDHVVGRIAAVDDDGVGLAERGARDCTSPSSTPRCRSTFVRPLQASSCTGRHAAAAAELGRDHELALASRPRRRAGRCR